MKNIQRARKTIPIGVKLHAVLLKIGFTDEEIKSGIDWDHDPPLALRRYDNETGTLIPDANDPRYITPLRRADHKAKTFGNKATTAGGDIHKIAKARRLAAKRAAFDKAITAKSSGEVIDTKTLKKKIPSRPFQKRGKK